MNTIAIEGKRYETYDLNEINQSKYIGFIYVTENKTTGKLYVGQHIQWDKYYLGSGKYLKRAIKKYGRKNFQKHIIDLAKTQQELDEKETVYINEVFNAVESDNWYNLKDGGQTGGYTCASMSEEELAARSEKISKNLKKYFAEHGSANKGRKRSDEVKMAVSMANKGRKLSGERKEQLREAGKYCNVRSCKLIKTNGEEITFISVAEAGRYFSEHYGMSRTLVKSMLKSGQPYEWTGKTPEKYRVIVGFKMEYIMEECQYEH